MPGRADALRALALVIPAYQAAATVGEVATRARRVLPGARCYVVDDGSEEGTAAAALASRLGVPVPDAQTGFRAFARALALAVQPPESRYDYETAFLLAALAAGYRVASVAVATLYNGEGSHFRYLADTWRLARVFSRYGRRIVLGAEGEGGGGRTA